MMTNTTMPDHFIRLHSILIPDFPTPNTAPGWYLVILLIVLLFTILFYRIWPYFLRAQKKRQILARFASLRNQTKSTSDSSQKCLMQLSIFIREVALYYYPQQNIAGLCGIKWLQFLDQTGHTQEFSQGIGQLLVDAPYQATYNNAPLIPLFDLVHGWLQQILQDTKK